MRFLLITLLVAALAAAYFCYATLIKRRDLLSNASLLGMFQRAGVRVADASERVAPEDPRFERVLHTWSTDQVETPCLITPRSMGRRPSWGRGRSWTGGRDRRRAQAGTAQPRLLIA